MHLHNQFKNMSQIKVKWWVTRGGCAYGAIPRKGVQAMLIYKRFSHLCKSVFVMGRGYMCRSYV
jgi:hypothetical protein